jgi:hypothetical protein
VPTVDRASELVNRLGSTVSFYKIGPYLQMARRLPEFADELVHVQKKHLFLDFKSVDIGDTMRGDAITPSPPASIIILVCRSMKCPRLSFVPNSVCMSASLWSVKRAMTRIFGNSPWRARRAARIAALVPKIVMKRAPISAAFLTAIDRGETNP